MVVNAGSFTQNLCRANLSASVTHPVHIVDGLGGPIHVASMDLLDKQGNIDVRRAGVHTGGIVAEQAARTLHERFGAVHQWLFLLEILLEFWFGLWSGVFGHFKKGWFGRFDGLEGLMVWKV